MQKIYPAKFSWAPIREIFNPLFQPYSILTDVLSVIAALVKNCSAMVANSSIVVVSWEDTNATGYIVYYHSVLSRNNRQETSATIPGTETTIHIHDLMSDTEYQFKISASAEFRGQQIAGDRSTCSAAIKLPPPSSRGKFNPILIGFHRNKGIQLDCESVRKDN